MIAKTMELAFVGFMGIAAAAPADLGLFSTIERFGLAIGLVIYFVFRDQKREKWMASQLETMQKEQRTVLMDALISNTKAITVFQESFDEFRKVISSCPMSTHDPRED